MPRETSSNFVAEKNAETNEPIWLYRIGVSDTPEVSGESDLFYTNQPFPVEYFKTDAGIDTPQTYEPAPIKHSGIGANMQGTIDSVTLTLSNVTRQAEAFIEARDALRGRRVTIRQIFRDELDDPQAYVEEVYYVDSVPGSDPREAKFRLTTKMDVLNVRVPRRRYLRNYCQAIYKGAGCWLDDGDGTFSMPSGFSLGDYTLLTAEQSGTGNPAIAQARFHAVNLKGFDQATDKLLIRLRTDNPSLVIGQAAGLELTSSGGPDANELQLNIADLSAILPTTAPVDLVLSLSTFTAGVGGFDPSACNFIRFFAFSSSGPITIYWSAAFVRTKRGDACNKRTHDCMRHNNIGRYNGFPGIPRRRVFRA